MKKMNSDRETAIIVGILFLLTEVTSVTGILLYHPILNDPVYIIKASVNETRVLWGAFFEVILAFANIGTAITLFPILKKYNECMALGAVCFRLLEAAIILIGIMSLLTMVTLNHGFLKETDPNVSDYLTAGKLLVAIHNWTFLFGPNLVLGPSTFLTGYLLYKSTLVPRFIAVLGLIGGALILVNALLVMLGIFLQISFWGAVMAAPVFFYEVSLAVWLLVKGFNPPSIADDPSTKITQFGRY
ncbi:MAG TPA: DUF4386 domain-containing protein [Mucilaginibacter sp.]|nr:DUF4386 domain-containing protein [Mucilaginibacter sp.]